MGKRKKKTMAGMTLIEVLAVIVIMGVMTSIAMPNFKSTLDKAEEKTDAANLQMLEGAVKQYRLDTGQIPSSLSVLLANPEGGVPGWEGPYLRTIPASPAGRTYYVDQTTGRVRLQ